MKPMKYIGLFLAMVSTQIAASEGGGSNYLPGFYGDFAMAVMPQQRGTYFNNFMTAFQDKSGKTATIMELPGIIQITDFKIFGGNYLFGIYPGVAVTKDHSGSSSLDRFGVIDAYLMPLTINWQWDKVSLLAYEGIIAPTGYYQKGALNTGHNIWTFDHVLSLTWKLPADNELSMTLGYMNNIKNNATGYRSGDELHFDYMLGHYLSPEFAAGVTGSFYRQITADHAPSSILAAVSSEASTIGPVMMFTPHIIDRDVSLSLKWLHEFNVQGRAAQDYLVWRVFMAF